MPINELVASSIFRSDKHGEPEKAKTPQVGASVAAASAENYAPTKSASIKFTLADMKGLYGLKSITILLDGQSLKTIQFGETVVFEVSPGQHTIQTKLVSRPILITLFFTITRKSTILNVNVAPNAQVSVMAKYSRSWGNIALEAKYSDQGNAKIPPPTSVAPDATASAEQFNAPTKVKQPDCIGIRFDIGKIDSGGYGEECWRVFWRAVDTEIVAGAQLLEGDTNDTPDRENVYCLAVKWWMTGSGRGDDVCKALEQSEEYRRVAAHPNYIDATQVKKEPLVEAGRVDLSGQILGNSYRALPALNAVNKEKTS